ncbi:uncharacterized protein LOC128551758 [Mercenaria mercenaria]|uniref:uncharacterized protein LOC128551758 n=1 Tax=Mercenaria mercenaria TaxID=6596 RepID=UPI00234E7C65|nr:uncharacterized protein LOC128551758 [Mercenaria mercenaria]
MAKRQKTDTVATDVQEPGRATDHTPSNLMIDVMNAATRTPDMNLVEFEDDISDFEIIPGSTPLSDSDVPPRIAKIFPKYLHRRSGVGIAGESMVDNDKPAGNIPGKFTKNVFEKN